MTLIADIEHQLEAATLKLFPSNASRRRRVALTVEPMAAISCQPKQYSTSPADYGQLVSIAIESSVQ